MLLLVHPCKSLSFPDSPPPLNTFHTLRPTIPNYSTPKPPIHTSFGFPTRLVISKIFPLRRSSAITFCSRNDVFDVFPSTHKANGVEMEENEELELLNKPSPVPMDNGSASEVDKESVKNEALAPFLKFFTPRDSVEEVEEKGGDEVQVFEEKSEVDDENEEVEKVSVEYYEPKPGDFVVGVVVSGNENKLDVNVGADLLGTMLTKEVLPLYDKEMEYLLCDTSYGAEEFMVRGKMGIVKSEAVRGAPMPGKPVVETGTILFAEVLGRTLSGRPLLSTRRLFRRIAWHRVRQIKQLNEPISVRITEWNTGGLLTRVEGLRAFLPKAELMSRVNNFTELKENVGCQMYVQITRIDEAKNDLVLSEREAWEMLNLREGTLLEGTVKKIFPYGAQVRIGETNRSGLLHISNITRARITSVGDLLSVNEKIKVLVVKSMFPDKISLSIADLESEPGLFVSNKEKFFSEAELMAKKYRQKLPAVLSRRSESPQGNSLPFDRLNMYANWKWFKFEK
ncbi:putative ribosomal protein S1 [Rosa chinensis]|uniref:Putative ribosomal protein S1 n=1 Tax=Rosa chinensis TaxID=74649 RepID=A0A2P6PRP7_ROSCH|nr:protein PIGMENT DEFECTIVE 338, chloroplastic isoform X1 [Rosa chinensis]PRQ24581.1 putative ribosomal protein S1 [Rosa chinensis]